MDSGGDERENHAMPQELCIRGRELFSKASAADDLFKARLLEFFSSVKKDDEEMKRIEELGSATATRTRRFIVTRSFAWSALSCTSRSCVTPAPIDARSFAPGSDAFGIRAEASSPAELGLAILTKTFRQKPRTSLSR